MSLTNPGRGGRGKIAPYQTIHYRIPKPIKPTTERLAAVYRLLVGTNFEEGVQVLLQQVDEAIAASLHPSSKHGTDLDRSDKVGTIYCAASGDESEDEDKQAIHDLERKIQELIVDNKGLQREKQALQTHCNQLDARCIELREQLAKGGKYLVGRTSTRLHIPDVLVLLEQALSMSPKAGGAIKSKIREAIARLKAAL